LGKIQRFGLAGVAAALVETGSNFCFSALAQWEGEHGLGARTRVAAGFYADLISDKHRLIERKDN
jgi:hypothetical protein